MEDGKEKCKDFLAINGEVTPYSAYAPCGITKKMFELSFLKKVYGKKTGGAARPAGHSLGVRSCLTR